MVFLETIAMGFIAKTVPQLNILSLGFPLRIMVGLGTVIAGITILGGVLVQYIDQVLSIMMSWYIEEGGPPWLKTSEKRLKTPRPSGCAMPREEGKVARSMDLTSALMLAGGAVVVWFSFGARCSITWACRCEWFLVSPGLRSVAEHTWSDSIKVTAVAALIGLLPVVLLVWLAALLANLVQVGFILAPKSIAPKLSKLNPLEGVKRVFGTQALVKAALDSLKVVLVLLVGGRHHQRNARSDHAAAHPDHGGGRDGDQ